MSKRRINMIHEAKATAKASPKTLLTPEELAFMQSKGYDPQKEHNVILSVADDDDRGDADRVSAIADKLPEHAVCHVIISSDDTKL